MSQDGSAVTHADYERQVQDTLDKAEGLSNAPTLMAIRIAQATVLSNLAIAAAIREYAASTQTGWFPTHPTGEAL